MDRQLRQWKFAVDDICKAAAPDFGEAARLIAEIATSGAEPVLRDTALQALPSLRAAMPKGADPGTRDLARRRLSLVRNALHVLTAPRFGKRGTVPEILTMEQRHRQVLGLPQGRRLAAAEIAQAYKQAARTLHPDSGGSARQFHELAAARDALMKER
jgi:hypothetical protein